MALSNSNGVNSLTGLQTGSLRDVDTVNITTPVPTAQPNVTSGVAPVAAVPLEKRTALDPLKVSKEYKQGQAILAGAKFMMDVSNAQSAYNSVKGTAAMNIVQARNQAADALSRGRQARLDRESEGYNAGNSALLNAAAQGQDVSGTGAQKIKGSYEAIGILNGMQEEINSMNEALGFELEEINYDYQQDIAEVNRNSAIIGSALNAGASLYVNGVI